MDRRQSEALDRYITGNYGEDQLKNVIDPTDIPYCKFLDELEASGNNIVSDPRDTFIAGWNAALEAVHTKIDSMRGHVPRTETDFWWIELQKLQIQPEE